MKKSFKTYAAEKSFSLENIFFCVLAKQNFITVGVRNFRTFLCCPYSNILSCRAIIKKLIKNCFVCFRDSTNCTLKNSCLIACKIIQSTLIIGSNCNSFKFKHFLQDLRSRFRTRASLRIRRSRQNPNQA